MTLHPYRSGPPRVLAELRELVLSTYAAPGQGELLRRPLGAGARGSKLRTGLLGRLKQMGYRVVAEPSASRTRLRSVVRPIELRHRHHVGVFYLVILPVHQRALPLWRTADRRGASVRAASGAIWMFVLLSLHGRHVGQYADRGGVRYVGIH